MTDTPHVSTHDAAADDRNDHIRIYVDGEIVHRDAAKVSVYDSGFMLGDGVWEGIRLHHGELVFLDRHLDRLDEGARAIGIVGNMADASIADTTVSRAVEAFGRLDALVHCAGTAEPPNSSIRTITRCLAYGASTACTSPRRPASPSARALGRPGTATSSTSGMPAPASAASTYASASPARSCSPTAMTAVPSGGGGAASAGGSRDSASAR